MPLKTNPAEAVKEIAGKDRWKSLRERMDTTFKLYRLDPDLYTIPKSEGQWDNYIPTHAVTEGNKLIDLLSYARVKLSIPLHAENDKLRKEISNTEYTAIGLLALADRVNEAIPDHICVQNLLAFYRVLRGWTAMRFLITEDDEDIVPDVAVWDVRNLYWQTSGKRISQVLHVRWASVDEIKGEYPDWNENNLQYINFNGESVEAKMVNGESLVPIYDVWDCSEKGKPAENGIIAGNEWVKEPEKVKLNGKTIDWLPIRISAGRSTPVINDLHDDNTAWVGEDYLANTRTLLPTIARVMSYKLEAAGKQAKAPVIIGYDSSNSDLPKAMEKEDIDPDTKSSILYLDKAKGEELAGRLNPPGSEHIDSTWTIVEGERSRGGLSAVAYGQINQALPAQGIDILAHATNDLVKPFKQGMEADLAWLATQMVHQYKYGDYDEREFDGYDSKNAPFQVTVKPEDVSDKPFQCELVLDLLRDRAAEVQMAASMITAGLVSPQTALDTTQLVDDTDLEQKKIAIYNARKVLGIGETEAVLDMVDDYAETKDPGKLILINMALMRLAAAAQQGMNGGQPGPARPGNPNAISTGGPMAVRQPVPPEVAQAARMQRMGLTTARQ